MRRKDHQVGFGKSFDSFLSIVTKNGLGMLILIAMATTFTSEQALSQPKFKKNLGTPLIKMAPPGLKAHLFECRGGRIVPVDTSGIIKQASDFFVAKEPQLSELARQYNAANLGTEYFTFEFQAQSGDEQYPNLPGILLKPREPARGDTLDDVKNPERPFRQQLKGLDPGKDALILIVRPDSFEFFRAAREVIQHEGFKIGWHPWEKPLQWIPVGGGGFTID